MNDERLRRHSYGFFEAARKPSSQELADYYANLYYQNEKGSYRKEYSQEELRFFDVKAGQRLAIVNGFRDGKGPGTLLDVGCGEGFSMAFMRRAGWAVHGIDHSIEGVSAMNPELAGCVEAGDLFRLLEGHGQRENRFDVVLLNNVLEHVPDPVALLSMLRKVVGPGGVLVVTVPNDFSDLQESLYASGDIPERFWIALPDHLAYFSAESLATTAAATGWRCLDMVSDFPVDLYLLHEGSNYIKARDKGPAAHRARVRMELMLGQLPAARANDLYRALARAGLGRNITAFLTPEP